MKKAIITFATVCVTLLLMSSCKSSSSTKPTDEAPIVSMPVFNADSAYNYVARQVAMGYRVPGTEAHKATARWLADEMTRHGAEVIRQEATVTAYDGTQLPICNIIAQFVPEKSHRILLAAHWDSRPYADHDPLPENHRKPIDGANDGASGVGVLLEIARHLSQQQPRVGVDIILFDAEDYGAPVWSNDDNDDKSWALGSQYWASHPHKPGYTARYGILLDMVGARGLKFYREYFSDYYAPQVVNKVWDCAARLGYEAFFVNARSGAITDDHIYMNKAGIPSIDIIQMDPYSETGFFPQWHTVEDNMTHIDAGVLGVVGETVLTVIYEE